RAGPTAYATGLEAARALLSRADRPDAAFCVTDLLACGFMDAARHEFGLRIPDELCVTGFDDIPQADWSSYALTTFAQPVEDIVRTSVEWLTNDADESGLDNRSVSLHASMVWRKTIRTPGR
ncbi:MAG: substrate-binding domain-containing protein, partial [Phyllobacterium sp.]|nr:substrate-binding domain-containing protein [Phyllobacterium sp.]